MKKIVRSFVLLASISVFASGCNMRKVKLVNTQELSIKDVEDISISYHSDSINFYKTDSDNLRIEEYLQTNTKKQKANIQTEKKKITVTGGERSWKSFTVGNDKSHIDIYLPKNYHNNLKVAVTSGFVKGNEPLILNEFSGSTNSGSLMVKSVNAKTVNVSTTSGVLKSDRIHGSNTDIKCKSGSVKIDELKSPTLTGKTTSGSLSINNFIGHASLTANSGNIKLNEVIGSAALTSTSGSIQSSFKKVKNDIHVQVNSGTIRLEVPQNLAFEFDSTINSGNVNTDFDTNLSKSDHSKRGSVGENPKVTITAQATSGNIDVSRNK